MRGAVPRFVAFNVLGGTILHLGVTGQGVWHVQQYSLRAFFRHFSFAISLERVGAGLSYCWALYGARVRGRGVMPGTVVLSFLDLHPRLILQHPGCETGSERTMAMSCSSSSSA